MKLILEKTISAKAVNKPLPQAPVKKPKTRSPQRLSLIMEKVIRL